jgi:hypothetical protein
MQPTPSDATDYHKQLLIPTILHGIASVFEPINAAEIP